MLRPIVVEDASNLRIFDTSKGEYPEHGEKVCGLVEGHYGNEWQVTEFVRGYTIEEQNKIPRFGYEKGYRFCDEHGNNLRGYGWRGPGPFSYNGQNIELWFRLPKC